MKRIKHFTIAALISIALINVGTKTLHADGFWNCYTIWWYTECYYVDVVDPNDDPIFRGLYALCQSLGLCP